MVRFPRKANMVRPNYKETDDMDNNNEEDEKNDSSYTTENQEEFSDEDRRHVKRKPYHRHSNHQIQEMEAFFKECPHPDEKQRKELSRQLGLDHLQIKFWFQNKRTQNKNLQERHDSTQLRTENDKLRAENQRYREAIANASCPQCGNNQTAIGEMSFEEHHMRHENGRIEKEVHRLSAMAGRYAGKMAMSYTVAIAPAPVPPRAFEMGMGSVRRGDVYGNGINFSWSSMTELTDVVKSRIVDLAVKALEELMKMAQAGEPLWVEGVNNGLRFSLNLDEYNKTFRKGLWPRPTGYRIEASKEIAIMVMNPINIVEKLMNVNQWSTMFAGIVAKVVAHEVLATGVTRDGALQLITAELQVLSPLVSTRRVVFARYCKKKEDGVWVVVDVSIDHIFPNPDIKCLRRPSGCLIEEIQNGYSKVTWVEHVEVDDRGGVHDLFRHLVSTGQALGANRWITTLGRQCERLNSIVMAATFPSNEHDGCLIMSNQGKMSLLKLGERMARSFFGGMTTSTADMWSILSGNAGDNIKVLTRSSSGDPGRPHGVILCAATSFWVPAPSNTIFDFLRDENNRTMWDVLTWGGSVSKLSHIPNGRDRRNGVSLFGCTNADGGKVMMIQESSTDPIASFMVYAPIDQPAIDMVVHGGDSDNVALLPSGFAILPDGIGRQLGGQGGSLLTISLQILVDQSTSARPSVSSVSTIENLMLVTMQSIKTIFRCPTA